MFKNIIFYLDKNYYLKIKISHTFVSHLVSMMVQPLGIKRECRENRQQFPLL